MEELNSEAKPAYEGGETEAIGADMSIRASGNGPVTYLAWSFDQLASFLRQSNSKVSIPSLHNIKFHPA